jgi:hypothetical protein
MCGPFVNVCRLMIKCLLLLNSSVESCYSYSLLSKHEETKQNLQRREDKYFLLQNVILVLMSFKNSIVLARFAVLSIVSK